MKKRFLSIMLCLALVLSVLPVGVLAEGDSEVPEQEIVETAEAVETEAAAPVQTELTEESVSDPAPELLEEEPAQCTHQGQEGWTLWESGNSLPADSGSYCLKGNVDLTDAWKISDGQTITVCLNGFDIQQTTEGKRVMEVTKGTLNLCDCTKSGQITGANITANGGAIIANGSTANVNLYDVTLSGNQAVHGGAVAVHNSAIFTMTGGQITGNTATGQGGGLYVVDSGSKVTLDGVTVTGNTTTSTSTRAAGGVHVNANNSTTLKGKVIITDNFRGTGENKVPSNLEVDYSRLAIDNALSADSSIGLSVYPENYTEVIKLDSKAAVGCYFSDDPNKIPEVKGNFLHLVAKPEVTHANTEGYTSCGHGTATWTKWDATDSLPTNSGTYFLANDVKLTNTWKISDGQTITVCLNGFDIQQTAEGKRVIEVTKGTLNLCDCTKSGQITGGQTTANGGAIIANGNSVNVNLYDITLTGNQAAHGGAVAVHGGAIFAMTGGQITGNTATGQGGGLYVVDSGSKVTLDGVSVTGNTTTSTSTRAAGGVHVNANNSTTLKGKVMITDNFRGTGENKVPSNLEIDYNRLAIDNALSADSSIGLSVYPETNTQAISLVSKAAVDCYFPDDANKITKVEGNVLHLVEKPAFSPNHADTEGYKPCGHGSVTWTDWFSGNSLPTTSGTYYLTEDVKISDSWAITEGMEVTLCLNGFDIIHTGSKQVIVMNGGKLSICDCTAKTENGVYTAGKITGANTSERGAGLNIQGGAEFNLYDGAITGNTSSSYGGGIYAHTSTINMYGGEISGNHADSQSGGGICVNGNVTLNITGGTIKNNSGKYAGAIIVQGAGNKALLKDCTITGNTASTRGGGVYVGKPDSVTLSGKLNITGNTVGDAKSNLLVVSTATEARPVIQQELDAASTIGIGIYLTTKSNVLVKSGATEQTLKCYISDDSTKLIEYSNGQLLLALPKHANTEGYTACDHDKITWTAWLNADSLPTDAGNYYLATDVNLTKVWNAGDNKEITICLNGHSITQTTDGLRVIRVGTSTLNICDCTAHVDAEGNYISGKITDGNTDASDAAGNAGAMLLTGTGTFRLYDGNITDNHTEGNGVIVVQKGFTFEMHGGAITENSAGKQGGAVYLSRSAMKMTGGEIRGNEAVGSGGAVYNYGSTFTMTGGVIGENESTTGGGGGIALKNVSDAVKATVSLEGGEIRGNVAKLDGSGIRMDSGVFKMSGGKVTENGREDGAAGGLRLGGGEATISGGEITKNIGNNAAGVFASCDLTISGGEISGNIGSGNGPGVYMSAAKLTMSGGKITGNEAGSNGGGVYLAQAEMVMTGGEISGNRGGMGGGIYNYGSSLVIKDGLIQNNAGYKLGGGGVYSNNRFESDNVTVKAEASLVIEGGAFSGNTSKTDGAGVRVDSGKFEMSGGLISGNKAEGAAGGLCIKNVETVEISGGTVTKNKAGNAAGVYFTKGTLIVSGGEFSYNEGTGSGAGMMVTSSEMKFSGGVIKNNTVKGDGAGLYVSDATLQLCGGKIQNNTAKKMCGGLLAAKNSKVYFSSGTISGNSAKASSGGMLIQTGSTLRMSGGTVSGNKTEKHGGGIYINKNSSGTISGGVISGNSTVKSGAGVYVGIEGYLTMAGGTISGNKSTTQGGGLVAVGKVNMTGGKITKNEAKLYGGGVYVTETTMTFSGGTVEENYAEYGGGFCVRGKGGVLKMSDDAKILNNECKESGGGMVVQAGAELFIDGGEICGNIAPAGGGGIRMHQCPAEIKNAKINNNTSNGQGAGIYSNLSLIIKDSEVCNNKIVKDPNKKATHSSGAIRAHNESTLEMENVKVIGNSCEGRAGAIEVAYDVDAIIKNCTFKDNTATEQGGTFYIYWEGQAYLYGCTIEDSSAPKGGAVSMDAWGEIEFHDCLITNNQADEGGVAYLGVRARSVFDGCAIKNNVAAKKASVIWANGDVVLMDTMVTENQDKGGIAAIYLTNEGCDTESYFPGVHEIMGDTIVRDNEGGDLVLIDNAFINIPGDGLGKDAKIQVKLQDADITRWIIGPYNYEVSGDGFLLTCGEQSLNELYMGSGESAPTDETLPEQEQQPEEQPKSKLPLIIGGGVAVLVLAAVIILIAALSKKKKR